MPKARLELARPCEHYDLNVACIPFHHFGGIITLVSIVTQSIIPTLSFFCQPLFVLRAGFRLHIPRKCGIEDGPAGLIPLPLTAAVDGMSSRLNANYRG